jgi:hypothetical protein
MDRCNILTAIQNRVQWGDRIYKTTKNRKCQIEYRVATLLGNTIQKDHQGVTCEQQPPPPPTSTTNKFSKHRYLHVSHHTEKSNNYQHIEVSSFIAYKLTPCNINHC